MYNKSMLNYKYSISCRVPRVMIHAIGMRCLAYMEPASGPPVSTCEDSGTWFGFWILIGDCSAARTRPTFSVRMASADQRRAIPFSAGEKALQEPPYVYTSGTIPVTERDAEYVFYQTWTDGRVPQKNVDVLPPQREYWWVVIVDSRIEWLWW